MAVEPRRGCGYRKVGGLYMVSGGLSSPCVRLPLELHVCPTCQAGIKQSRAWTWVKARALLAGGDPCRVITKQGECAHCPLSPANLPETAGLLWIGEKFYPTADDFMREAHTLGVSRRIPAVPRNFKLGQTWVLIAHPCAVRRLPQTEEEQAEAVAAHLATLEDGASLDFRQADLRIVRGGIVTMFKPTAIEKIVTESQAQDTAAMQELEQKGITPIVVPDGDKDHQGTAHDKPDDDEPPVHLADNETREPNERPVSAQTGFFE